MTYDYHGQWEKLTDFNAPLYHPADLHPPRGFFNLPHIPDLIFDPLAACIELTVRWITETQIPPYRLALGLPFYGRAWQLGLLSDPEAYGYAQPAAGPAEGSFDYREIAARCLGRPGFTRHWHATARVPWLHHAERGLFISYDDPESLRAKVAFALEESLGGVMIWELSGDDGSLLPVVHQALQPKIAA